jgi:hypothetical protein
MSGFVKTPTERELEILRYRLDKLEKRVEDLAATPQPPSGEQERGSEGRAAEFYAGLDYRSLDARLKVLEAWILPSRSNPATAPPEAATATPAPPNEDLAEVQYAAIKENHERDLRIPDPTNAYECAYHQFINLLERIMAAEIQRLRTLKGVT